MLVSRWAARREARRAHARSYRVRPVGALAYSRALVAAGRADALWSRTPKAEWDIAAGVALILAAGGDACAWDGSPITLNRWPPRAPGLVACAAPLARPLRAWLARR